MNQEFFVEIYCSQKNHDSERICGDFFLSEKIKEENRVICVLSDGLGHGVKANILATLTAKMALNFTREHKDFKKTAEIIMNTLPECSDRKINYATFTIVDIEINRKTYILEYDNPGCTIFRSGKVFNPGWKEILLEGEKNAGKKLRVSSYYPQKEDRILIYSDGITQSGMGGKKYPFGWGLENTNDFVEKMIQNNPTISAFKLASKIVNMANQNDGYHSKDDTSCASIYFRNPRKLIISTGPPFNEKKDKEFTELIKKFDGKKIICGATTADIIARELNLTIRDNFDFTDDDLPPTSSMEGFELITEGILTLSKIARILNKYDKSYALGTGPADQIIKLMFKSDEIQFLVGTKINIAHQDPNIPMELELRRTVVHRIARELEGKFYKEVKMTFI
ncbi:MAG: SpoIIE family protein phosphatase [Bacteroidales bacterium]|nr:SpoIIE family protein phosphatase [Bacteroidales bacterium]